MVLKKIVGHVIKGHVTERMKCMNLHHIRS